MISRNLYNKRLKNTKSSGIASDVFMFVKVNEEGNKKRPKKLKSKLPKKLRTKKIKIKKLDIGFKRSDVQAPKDYYKYIKSVFWENRKKEFWKRHKKQCERCQTKRFVQLHHGYYDSKNFGNEPDWELNALCIDCHELFHNKFGVKKDMIEETELFIRRIESTTEL